MNVMRVVYSVAFAAVIVCGPPAMAVTWNELGGDAGDVPATAQVTTGVGSLTQINGTLGNHNDADMYRIFITGGGTFSATANQNEALQTPLQLFLFDEDGYGVYYDDDSGVDDTPWLPSGVTYTPTEAGIYYLAISAKNNDPIIVPSTTPIVPGNYIFGQGDYTDGPDGDGAASPIMDWDDDGWDDEFADGDYRIILTGTEFATYVPPNGGNGVIPEPLTVASLAFGMAAVSEYVRRKRRV